MSDNLPEYLDVPQEWVEIIEKLHPITAVVVWAVLTNQVTAEIISLAKYSPDLHRYHTIRIIAGGSPRALDTVTQLAYENLYDIFSDLLSNPRSQRLH